MSASQNFQNPEAPPLFIGVDNIFFACIIGCGWMISSVFKHILHQSIGILANTNVSDIITFDDSLDPVNLPAFRLRRTPEAERRTPPRRENYSEITDDNQSENAEPEERAPTRNGYDQIRIGMAREQVTLVNYMQNLAPFLILFAVKLISDHFSDICRLLMVVGFFFQADYFVQKIVASGITNKIIRVVSTIAYTIGVIVYMNYESIEDFSFSNTYGLNITYFISGEFKSCTFTSTLYGTVITDVFFKLITIIPKLYVLLVPDHVLHPPLKRKCLQFIEYCSQLYRSALPFGPWVRYHLFNSTGSSFFVMFYTICYFLLKLHEVYRYSAHVRRALRYLVSDSSFGSAPNKWEVVDECAVCHEEMENPIKLECNHIFCKSCIETWLDQNVTCPICRAVVSKNADNDWKNGGTSRAFRFF